MLNSNDISSYQVAVEFYLTSVKDFPRATQVFLDAIKQFTGIALSNYLTVADYLLAENYLFGYEQIIQAAQANFPQDVEVCHRIANLYDYHTTLFPQLLKQYELLLNNKIFRITPTSSKSDLVSKLAVWGAWQINAAIRNFIQFIQPDCEVVAHSYLNAIVGNAGERILLEGLKDGIGGGVIVCAFNSIEAISRLKSLQNLAANFSCVFLFIISDFCELTSRSLSPIYRHYNTDAGIAPFFRNYMTPANPTRSFKEFVIDFNLWYDKLNTAFAYLTQEYIAHCGGKLLVVYSNSLEEIPVKSPREQWLLEQGGDLFACTQLNAEPMRCLYGAASHFPPDYLAQIKNAIPDTFISRRGLQLKDVNSKYLNIIGGYRVTPNIPNYYENSIFVLGNSRTLGVCDEDANTLPSILQKKITTEQVGKYAVFNLGIGAMSFIESCYKILNLPLKLNDIVVIHGYSIYSPEKSSVRAPQIYGGIATLPIYLHNRMEICGECFVDGHLNYKGSTIEAEQIFHALFSENGLVQQNDHPTKLAQDYVSEQSLTLAKNYYSRLLDERKGKVNSLTEHPDFSGYLRELARIKSTLSSTVNNGCIVMNCNPFTLGHLYLVKYAASKVCHLFVFVVEEDRSFFRFSDRFNLVHMGVREIPNITVLRSGSFVISTITFPEYFVKDKQKDTRINASLDLDVFGEHIAPLLGITKRFVGEEPLCPITRQYNFQMRLILPTYGINVEEITRKELDGQPISATAVRECIKRKDHEQLKKIVPPTTYDFCVSRKFDCK